MTEDKKELEILLTTYIALKKDIAQCSAFIDGFEAAIEYLRKGQTLPMAGVNKRLLFAAYLQGKSDQIYWPTKWEDYEPIGKYRVMKQFLKWHSTVC
jgi:hypothetical protein